MDYATNGPSRAHEQVYNQFVNPFGTEAMAAGYAASRPPLHRRIVERASVALGSPRRALDIGCGAGLSTRALEGLASHCVGLEPAEAMLGWTRGIAPQANFVVGRAEALPFAGR